MHMVHRFFGAPAAILTVPQTFSLLATLHGLCCTPTGAFNCSQKWCWRMLGYSQFQAYAKQHSLSEQKQHVMQGRSNTQDMRASVLQAYCKVL